MTQKQILREALESGHHLSKLQILQKYGIWNTSDVVMKLRKDGVPIKTEMVKNKLKKNCYFAVYYI